MKKRVLAFILMITLLAGNTMSVSATAGVSGNEINTLTESESLTGEEASSENESGEEESVVNSTEETSIVEGSTVEGSTEPSGEDSFVEDTTVEEDSSEAITETTEEESLEWTADMLTEEIEAVEQSVENLCVAEQSFGEICLTWGVANDSDDGTTVSFNIYRAESEDGPFDTPYKTLTGLDSGQDSYSYTDKDNVFIDDGINHTYYYKVSIVSGDTDFGASEVVTNKDMYYCYLSSDDMEYVGMYLEDAAGNRVSSITMRPEEYLEYQLVLVKKDGTEFRGTVEDGNETTYGEDSVSWYICSQPAKDVADVLNNDLQLEDSLMELVPIDFDKEYKVGVTAHNTVQTGGKYYLFAQRGVLDLSDWEKTGEVYNGRFWVQIPITIAGVEEGDVYNKMVSGTNNVYLSSDELSQGMRDDMVEREKTGIYYVKESVYEAWVKAGGTDAVYDFNRERKGMKPDEGDYLFWQNFDPQKIMSIQDGQWIFTPTYFNGENWYRIDSNQVYFTTAAQEKAVTERIDWLLRDPAGDLYSLYTEYIQYYEANGGYSPEQSKAIADALCDYVYNKTTYYGTVTPQYHSAWSAIINKKGTCQAFALYYTRLLREFGIATKILTGTDKNYHTYNIVQIDAANDEWYYYDATGGIKYKTESEFSRTQYQGLFIEDPLFVENYLSKIKGSSYAPQVYLYADGEKVGEYFTVEAAADAMILHNEAAEDTDISYRIALEGDVDMGASNMILPKTITYCELDLQGHTITARNGAALAVDKVSNGTFYMTEQSSVWIYAPENGAESTVYENLKFTFDQANGGFYVQSTKLSAEDEEQESTVAESMIQFSNVQVEKNFATEITGTVSMDEKSSLTTGILTLYNSNADAESFLLGSVKADSANTINGCYHFGNLAISGNVEIRTGSVLNIRGTASLGNVFLNEWASSRNHWVSMNLVEVLDENGHEKSTGNLTFNGTLTYSSTDITRGCYVELGKQQISMGGNAESEPLSVKFDSGETIATVKKDVSQIPTEYFVLANAEEDEYIRRSGNNLMAARTTVRVTYEDAAADENPTKDYISLEEAAASLKADFAGASGEYTFTFIEDSKLNAGVTIPSFVKTLHLQAEGKASDDGVSAPVKLDFNGYSISTSAVTDLEHDLILVNGEKTKTSKFTTTAKNGSNDFALKVMAENTDVNAEHLTNITVVASNGTVEFASITAEQVEEGASGAGVGTTEDNLLDGFHTADASITAKEVKVSSGKWNLGTVAVTNFINESIVHVTKINNVQNVDNKADKILVVDTYTQKSNGKTNLESGSIFVIKEKATLYNTALVEADSSADADKVYIYRMPETADTDSDATPARTVALEGKLTSANESLKLEFGVLDADDETAFEEQLEKLITTGPTVQVTKDLLPRTVLFTSKISSFPVDLVQVNQLDTDSNYREVYQQDTDIMVGREWIVIYTKRADGSEELLKSFLRWSDAAAYLNTLSNSPMEYVVELREDIESNKALTMPSKTGGITFRGKSETSMITITYTGDLKLLSDTTFENIRLEGIQYNSKTKTYVPYQSKVTLNGKTLTFVDSSTDFYSIAGNASSCLVIKNKEVKANNDGTVQADITVTKGVTSLGYLDMDQAVLKADNVTVTNTLSMASSTIDCATKITVKDLVSEDSDNMLVYGGNKNLLTISGSITAGENGDSSDETVTVKRTEYAAEDLEKTNPITIESTATIRKNAITLKVTALEPDNYKTDLLLAGAAKAGAGWFVVGSEWTEEEGTETRTITYATYKYGNNIYCGEIEENVRLYSADTEADDYVYESSFATLQEAFAEIDKLAVTTKYYYIELVNTADGEATSSAKGFTFPSKSAGITIAADVYQSNPVIFYKGNLTLKCNTTLEDITLVPTVKGSISLGNYCLTLERCTVDTTNVATPFSGISGSSVSGASALVLDDTVLYVSGAVNNVGTIVFTGEEVSAASSVSTFALRSVSRSVPVMPTLTAEGKINIGNVELGKDGELIGLASVTRNKSGVITQIAPQITINGEVYDTSVENVTDENTEATAKTLYVDLLEKTSGGYETLNFNGSDATAIKETGIRLAKASVAAYPNIKATQAASDAVLVKSSGYLTYFAGGYGVMLSFVENEKTVEIPCRTFADAVTEINSRKNKNDYVLTLTEDCAEISGAGASGTTVVPQALTMPNKNYVNSLTIQADPTLTAEKQDAVKLGFLGNITFTSEVTLDNVHLVQMIKSGSVYKSADTLKDDYPSAVTINTGGFDLHVLGKVTINTPLILNGGSKASLTLDEKGTINTQTNGFDPASIGTDGENVIYGQITGFATVTLDGVDVNDGAQEISLTLKEYKPSSYAASSNSITNLNLTNGKLTIVGDNAKGALTVTNLAVNNGEIAVGGKANLKNVFLEGAQRAKISADTDFNITGTLTSLSNGATLYTRLKGVGKAPYLNISGTVIRGNGIQPIYVGVKREWAAGAEREDAAALYDAPKVTAQLLTAKNAPASDFQPVEEAAFDNYKVGSGKYSADNLSGYMMMKSGSNVYVYDGSQVRVAVYYGDLENADLHSASLEETALARQQLFGYFTTIKDATTAVNALKNKEQAYTYVLMSKVDTVGTIASPMAVSLPAYAKKVTVTSLVNSDTEEKTIYLSGSITLACETEFDDVIFAPVNKSKSTTFTLAAGGWDLTLKDVSVSTELDGKMALKDISGNGKQTITLDSKDLIIFGSITNAKNVIVKEDVAVNGTLKTTELTLENTDNGQSEEGTGAASGVVLTTKGTVTIDTIYNNGTATNTLAYSRTNKNVTRLTINKEIVNATTSNPLVLEQLTGDSGTIPVVLGKTGVKAALSDAKKLAVMPKASTDSFVLAGVAKYEDGTELSIGIQLEADTLHIVKASKGIYLTDASLRQDEVALTRQREVTEASGILADNGTTAGIKTNEYACLDYTQAVNEINNQADKTSFYTIAFTTDGVTPVVTGASKTIDTVVTDSYADSAFAMPKANMAAGLVIKGYTAEGETAGSSQIPFTGNITAYGHVTMENLILQPVKSGTNSAAVDVTLTFNADKTAAEPDVVLENVTTAENVKAATNGVTADSAAGFINTITGTKNKTKVTLKNCGSKSAEGKYRFIVKSGINNLAELSLESTNLLSVKTSTLTNVRLDNASSWDSLDKLTVTDIYVPTGVNQAYIGIRQDKNANPLFVVNGEIYENGEAAQNAGTLQCKVYPVTTTLSSDDEIYAGTADIISKTDMTTYEGVYLASAKKATADRFRAYEFRNLDDNGTIAENVGGINKDNLIAYKVGAYVVNGNLNNMAVKITESKDAEGGSATAVGTFYATSYDNAVTIIQNKADKTSCYELELLSEGVVMTTKNGSAIGAFTIPDKAKSITIVGQTVGNAPATMIKYTGGLKANVDVAFKNLILTEGTADKKEEDGFREYGTITPTPGSNYTMTFDNTVYTYDADKTMSERENGELLLAAASSSKGKITLDGNQVTTKGGVTLNTLTLLNGATLATDNSTSAKINITNVCVDDNKANAIMSQNAMTLGTITGLTASEGDGTGSEGGSTASTNGQLLIQIAFAKIKKAGTYGNPQLTVSGLVENAELRIQPLVYDLTAAAYREMEAADFEALLVTSSVNPSTYMKFATMPKATLDTISLVGKTVENSEDQGATYSPVYTVDTNEHLYKYETGLYLTDLDPQVKVTGYRKRTEDGATGITGAVNVIYDDPFYEASFLTWDQAVKEIDKISDISKYYKITLLENVGESAVSDAPVGTLTLPAKAAEVLICSDNAADENGTNMENGTGTESNPQYGVFFTGSTITVKCNTRMEGISLVRVKVSGKGETAVYTSQAYTINTGNFHLLQKEMEDSVKDAKGTTQQASYAVSGSSKGTWEYIAAEGETVSNITKISGVGNVVISAPVAVTSEGNEAQVAEEKTFAIPEVSVSGDFSTQNLILADSILSAKNITVSNHTTLDSGKLHAGTVTTGDGKLTLKNLILLDNENQLAAKQDKNGNTQINLNGILYKASEVYGDTIQATEDALSDGSIEVALYYNNRYKPAQLYNKMTLLNAQKFPASLFVPMYTEKDGDTITKSGMGLNLETGYEPAYALYKSGKAICYGKTSDTREVLLTIGGTGLTTYFASFEEAVKEIDTLALYKDPTAKVKAYEDYTITLLQDVEIGNTKKNNSFSGLSLPAKASSLIIEGNPATAEKKQLRFWGNVTIKCNTELRDITMLPLKNVSGKAVPTAVNYALGNYTLRMSDVVSRITSDMKNDASLTIQSAVGESLIGNVTGSSKTGTFILSESSTADGGESASTASVENTLTINQSSGLREIRIENGARLHTKGTVSVYQFTFGTEGEEGSMILQDDFIEPVLEADGKLTVTLIKSVSNIAANENDGNGNAGVDSISHGIIRKPVASVFTWNGVYEDRNGDKVKEYHSLNLPETAENGCVTIELIGTPCPIGTTIVTGKYLTLTEGIKDQLYVTSRSSAAGTEESVCNLYVNGPTFYVADKK